MVTLLSEAVDGEEMECNRYTGRFCSTLTHLQWLRENLPWYEARPRLTSWAQYPSASSGETVVRNWRHLMNDQDTQRAVGILNRIMEHELAGVVRYMH